MSTGMSSTIFRHLPSNVGLIQYVGPQRGKIICQQFFKNSKLTHFPGGLESQEPTLDWINHHSVKLLKDLQYVMILNDRSHISPYCPLLLLITIRNLTLQYVSSWWGFSETSSLWYKQKPWSDSAAPHRLFIDITQHWRLRFHWNPSLVVSSTKMVLSSSWQHGKVQMFTFSGEDFFFWQHELHA